MKMALTGRMHEETHGVVTGILDNSSGTTLQADRSKAITNELQMSKTHISSRVSI